MLVALNMASASPPVIGNVINDFAQFATAPTEQPEPYTLEERNLILRLQDMDQHSRKMALYIRAQLRRFGWKPPKNVPVLVLRQPTALLVRLEQKNILYVSSQKISEITGGVPYTLAYVLAGGSVDVATSRNWPKIREYNAYKGKKREQIVALLQKWYTCNIICVVLLCDYPRPNVQYELKYYADMTRVPYYVHGVWKPPYMVFGVDDGSQMQCAAINAAVKETMDSKRFNVVQQRLLFTLSASLPVCHIVNNTLWYFQIRILLLFVIIVGTVDKCRLE